MSIPPISTVVTGSTSLRPERSATVGSGTGDGFGDLVTSALNNVSAAQNNADQLANKAAVGQLSDPHEYMIAATEASLATELTVAVRQRVDSARHHDYRMAA